MKGRIGTRTAAWTVVLILAACASGSAIGSASALASASSPASASTSASPNGIVGLITDYGEQDFYVGALKGAILTACPEARIVDLSHDVPPYDVRLAAWQLWDSAREFPPGTVIVAIVDPGVGTGRRPLVLRTASGHWFLGPDNGLFSVVEKEMGPGSYREITNPAFMRKGAISTSFHGRDIFGPAAGHVACGDPFEDAGPSISDPIRTESPEARVESGALVGEVLFVDHYGNVQTNIPGSLLARISVEAGDSIAVDIGTRVERAPLVAAYGDVAPGAILALIASTGRIEIARNQQSAAEMFDARPGSRVTIRRARDR